MNFLGTHDTPRIMTVLGARRSPQKKDDRAHYRLSPAERARGTALVKLAALMLFTFPGSPTVYYGDEAGMEGFEDPFNRGGYPWGHEDLEMKSWFFRLGCLRAGRKELQKGSIEYHLADGALLCFERRLGNERCVTVVNAGPRAATVTIPWGESKATDALSGRTYAAKGGQVSVRLSARSGALLV